MRTHYKYTTLMHILLIMFKICIEENDVTPFSLLIEATLCIAIYLLSPTSSLPMS